MAWTPHIPQEASTVAFSSLPLVHDVIQVDRSVIANMFANEDAKLVG